MERNAGREAVQRSIGKWIPILILFVLPVAVYAGLLSPPDSVNAEDREEGGVSLSWSTVEGAYGYAVYRSNSQFGEFTRIYYGSDLAYSDLEVDADVEYFYTVGAEEYYGSLPESAAWNDSPWPAGYPSGFTPAAAGSPTPTPTPSPTPTPTPTPGPSPTPTAVPTPIAHESMGLRCLSEISPGVYELDDSGTYYKIKSGNLWDPDPDIELEAGLPDQIDSWDSGYPCNNPVHFASPGMPNVTYAGHNHIKSWGGFPTIGQVDPDHPNPTDVHHYIVPPVSESECYAFWYHVLIALNPQTHSGYYFTDARPGGTEHPIEGWLLGTWVESGASPTTATQAIDPTCNCYSFALGFTGCDGTHGPNLMSNVCWNDEAANVNSQTARGMMQILLNSGLYEKDPRFSSPGTPGTTPVTGDIMYQTGHASVVEHAVSGQNDGNGADSVAFKFAESMVVQYTFSSAPRPDSSPVLFPGAAGGVVYYRRVAAP